MLTMKELGRWVDLAGRRAKRTVREIPRLVGGKKRSRKGMFFRKSLAWILLVSSIPGIVIGFAMFWIGDKHMKTELQKLHHSQIVKRAQNIDDQFHYIELAINHWAFDPRFSDKLVGKNLIQDFQDAWDISQTLRNIKGAHPLALQVELYLQGSPSMVFKPDYNNLVEQPEMKVKYERLLREPQTVYWTDWPDGGGGSSSFTQLTMVHKIPGNSLSPFGLLAVQLNQEKLRALLNTLTPYDEGETFLMNESGQFLIATSSSPESLQFKNALKETILNRAAANGSFLFKWKKTLYSVSYGNFSRIGENWSYVSAAPIDVITAPVVLLSKFVIGFSLSGLLLAFILSWVASKRLYSPVDRLVRRLAPGGIEVAQSAGRDDEFRLIEEHWQHLTRESSVLQSRLEAQLSHVKEGFLLQFLQGAFKSYTENELRDRMKQYGWMTEGHQFVVLYIHLTGFGNVEGRFSHDEEGLVSFAAANIVQELAAECFEQTDVINFHNLEIGLFLVVPEGEAYRGPMNQLCEELMKAINHIIHMQLTITVGRTGSVAEVPSVFEEAARMVQYRAFENQNQVLDMSRIEAEKEVDELHYPFLLEREIIQRLRTGQRQEAEQLVSEFLDTVIAKNSKEMDVQQAMLQLLGSIQHAMLHAGVSPNKLYKGINMYEQLSQIRDRSHMGKWFQQHLISPYIEELEARSDSQLKRMVDNAVEYIQHHYMEDLSLDFCAQRLGTNPFFLSKAFKKVSGKNFIDYITECRMEKAKEMLRDTETKIQDIAVQVGYQHSYFDRIFKKIEGVTPKQYRERSRGL